MYVYNRQPGRLCCAAFYISYTHIDTNWEHRINTNDDVHLYGVLEVHLHVYARHAKLIKLV